MTSKTSTRCDSPVKNNKIGKRTRLGNFSHVTALNTIDFKKDQRED